MRDSTRPGTSVADGEELSGAGQPLLSSPRSFRLISLRNSGSSSGAMVRVGRAGRCGRATPGPDDESAPGVRAPIPRQAKAITRIVTAIATSMYIGHLLLCCSEYAHPDGGELSNMGDVFGDAAPARAIPITRKRPGPQGMRNRGVDVVRRAYDYGRA